MGCKPGWGVDLQRFSEPKAEPCRVAGQSTRVLPSWRGPLESWGLRCCVPQHSELSVQQEFSIPLVPDMFWAWTKGNTNPLELQV